MRSVWWKWIETHGRALYRLLYRFNCAIIWLVHPSRTDALLLFMIDALEQIALSLSSVCVLMMPLFVFWCWADALLFFHVPFSTDCSLVGEMISIIVYLDYIDTPLLGSLEYEIYGLLCFQSEESDNNDCRSYALRHTAPAVQKNERESLYFLELLRGNGAQQQRFSLLFFFSSWKWSEIQICIRSLSISLCGFRTQQTALGYEVLMFFYANEPLISEPAEADY